MIKLGITCEEDGSRVWIKHKVVLGVPATLKTCLFENATLFDDPDTVEGIIRDFDLNEPRIEIVKVSYVRPVGEQQDKYTVFLLMSSERAYPDRPSVEIKTSAKIEDDSNYPLYLFSMLWHSRYEKYSKTEYDLVYPMIMSAWENFKGSEYDDDNIGLYECILNFFDEKKMNKAKRVTSVFYRKVIKSPQAGSVIAVFPHDVFDVRKNMASYMHIGQHSGCSEDFVLEDTVATKSACDTYGCMPKELESYGYDDLEEIPYDSMRWKPKGKCLYCDNGCGPTHFICEDCGDGMCESCYDVQTEHDAHFQDPANSAETKDVHLLLKDVFGNGYGCNKCVNKVMQMNKNIAEEQE